MILQNNANKLVYKRFVARAQKKRTRYNNRTEEPVAAETQERKRNRGTGAERKNVIDPKDKKLKRGKRGMHEKSNRK